MSSIQIKKEIGKDTILFWLIILITIIITWALFFHIIEWHSLFNSFYFVMMTMTTVGYGDIVPYSTIGKLITILYAMMGIPLFVFIGWYIVEHRITAFVKDHIKQQSKHIGKIESEIDDIGDEVDDISESIENIHEKVNEIDHELHTHNK